MATLRDTLRSAYARSKGFRPPPPPRYRSEEKYGAAPSFKKRSYPTPSFNDLRAAGDWRPARQYTSPTWYELAEAGEWPLNPFSLGLADLNDTGEPGYPPMPSGGGGGGGQGKVSWAETYQLAGAPDWWKGFTPSRWTPESEYMSTMNALLPYLSPEDQRSVASSLARMDQNAFGRYSPETVPFIPPADLTTDIRRQFQSTARAQNALASLSRMLAAAGRKPEKAGPGYAYMRQVADVVQDFGGPGGPSDSMTATDLRAMLGALDPLLAEGKGNPALAAFEPLARMFAQPFFSAGALFPSSKLPTGQTIFGTANPSYF